MTTTPSRSLAPPGGAPAGPGERVSGPETPEPSNGWALARLLAAVVLIAGLFIVLGGGPLLVVIVAILLMVMIHELGHFATAKWSRMKVTEYFVGFGPRLWSIRRGETDYGIKPILAGGYVKIPGMTNLEEIDPADESRTYRQQPFHNRIIVACAGSFMHFVMAFFLAWAAVLIFGVPSTTGVSIGGFEQWAGHTQNAAQQAGLKVGDDIVAVNGHKVTDPNQLVSVINDSPGKKVTLEVDRGGKLTTLTVVPAIGRTTANGHETITTATSGAVPTTGKDKAIGLIGIQTAQVRSSEGPIRAIGTSVIDIGTTTSATVAGLAHLFSPHGLSSLYGQVTNAHDAQVATANGTRPSSIVGAVRVATQAEQTSWLDLIDVLIALNIVIGLVNLLPMLPLDGGHVAIAVYERIRTRRGKPYYQADAAKLLPVVYVFVALLVVVVGSAVFLDIAHPMANPFN
jgi:membrane-associated protease RseP (regulator of RpoE activity)